MNTIRNFILLPVVLNLFDAVINKTTSATTGNDLSGEMKTFYSDYLIDMAEPLLVHDQFGQKHPIPKNGGKTIEFRKYDPLPKATTALTEGVTPEGQKLNMGVITATVAQYGGFIELSDMLLLSAIDNNLVQATKLLGSQAGRMQTRKCPRRAERSPAACPASRPPAAAPRASATSTSAAALPPPAWGPTATFTSTSDKRRTRT